MKSFLSLCLACWMTMATTQALGADLPLWEVGVFSGAASTPAYPGSADRASLALTLPFLIYRGEVWRVDQDGVGARMVHTDTYEFDVGLAASLPSRSSDLANRQGMPDLGFLVEFGPRMKVTLARPGPQSRLLLVLPVRAVAEIRSGVREQGLSFEPELVFESRDLPGGWRASVGTSLVFGDRRLNDYFYGVAPPYATSERPAFDARAGLIATRFAINASKHIGTDVRVFGFVQHESYAGSANLASPLHRQAVGVTTGFALVWTLGRSEARAKD